MNSKLFQPFSACAQHARTKRVFGYLLWPLGMVLILMLAFPVNSPGATLSGTVFVDIEGTNDWGVRGSVIQLYNDTTGELIDDVLTNAYGQYSFSDLGAGTYRVVNTIPCELGNSADVGQVLTANSSLPGTGTANSALVQISGIVLAANYKAINYNFGNDQYPMKLYSKRLLTFSRNDRLQPITVVPEPTTILQLLAAVGLAGSWAVVRKRQRPS